MTKRLNITIVAVRPESPLREAVKTSCEYKTSVINIFEDLKEEDCTALGQYKSDMDKLYSEDFVSWLKILLENSRAFLVESELLASADFQFTVVAASVLKCKVAVVGEVPTVQASWVKGAIDYISKSGDVSFLYRE